MLREVRVENGLVRGLPAADPRIAYKGIYAAPPVGISLKAPQPARIGGVLKFHFGPLAMQETSEVQIRCTQKSGMWMDTPMSEDCLHLNV